MAANMSMEISVLLEFISIINLCRLSQIFLLNFYNLKYNVSLYLYKSNQAFTWSSYSLRDCDILA